MSVIFMRPPSFCDSCGVRIRDGYFVRVIKSYPPFKNLCQPCAATRQFLGLIHLHHYKKNEKGWYELVEDEDLSQSFFDEGESNEIA